MQKYLQILFVVAITATMAAFGIARAAPQSAPQASATSFHFVFSADSRDDYTVLPALSHKMVTLSPVLGVFGGDLCGSFDTSCINNTWKPALDGNNNDGMLAKTFVLRGNHDSGTLSTWQGLWDFQAMAVRVGATYYTAQTSDATYSFDYGNSHFAILDNPGGGASTLTSTQISWLDADLTAAEGRGVAHEFLFTHGPMYGVTSQHGSDYPSSALKTVLNKHPISAGFNGHEHITQYTHVTPSVEAGINSFEEFTMGRAGAPAYSVVKHSDWHSDTNAFADIAVNGSQFTVTVYSQAGSAIFTKTFTDGAPAPTATPAATRTPGPTATPGSGSSVTYVSTGAYDGQVLESNSTSAAGGSYSATGMTFRLGDDASNRQYRGILSFNTAGLPDNATIKSVRLKMRTTATTGSSSNPFSSLGNIAVDIIHGPFSANVALQAGDFQAAAGKSAALTITNSPVNSWYTTALASSNFSYINKTSVTQVRLRFTKDSNNNGKADYIAVDSGENATTSYRPVLVITYTVP